MSRGVVRFTALAVLVHLAAVGAGAAAPGSAILASQDPVTLLGDLVVGGGDSRALLRLQGEPFTSEGTVDGLLLTHHRWRTVEVEVVGPHGVTRTRQSIDHEAVSREWRAATVRLEGGGVGDVRAASDAGGIAVVGGADATGDFVFLDRELRPTGAHFEDSGLDAWAYPRLSATMPAGWLFAGALADGRGDVEGFPPVEAPTLRLVGPSVVQLTAGALVVAGAEGEVAYALGPRERPGGVTEWEAVELVLGAADWSLPLAGRWGFGTRDPALGLDGTLALSDARGTVGEGPDATPVTSERVVIAGEFRVVPRVIAEPPAGILGARSVEYRVDGEFEAVIGGSIGGGAAGLALAAAASGAAASVAIGSDGARAGAARVVASLYHRVPTSAVLTNDVRRRIVDEVRANPGVHLRALARALDLTWGRLLYHLRVLERARLIALRRHGRYRLVYPVGDVAAEPSPATPPLHPVAQAVLAAVSAEGSVPARALQERLGVSRQRLSYHLKGLARRGSVRIESTPSGKILHPPPGLDESERVPIRS